MPAALAEGVHSGVQTLKGGVMSGADSAAGWKALAELQYQNRCLPLLTKDCIAQFQSFPHSSCSY